MKRFFGLLLLFSFLLSTLFLCGTASAESASPYDLAEQYASSYARRDVLSGSEAAAGRFLGEYLSARGYTVTSPSFHETVERLDGQKVVYEYSHVIGFKDNGKGKTLLIGGYYGGYEPTDSYGVGEGATVALSVGAILYVADALSTLSLDYDLAIAFWGGMELGVDLDLEKCGVEVEKVALYVNFERIAAGRNDYLYADDLPRSQEKYFSEIISEQGASILPSPAYKKPAAFLLEGAYSYLHLGLIGANRFFLNEGIPCVSLIGGAWEEDGGLYPYPGKGDLEGTSIDTLAQINELNGGKEATASRLLAAANVVIAGLTDARLTAVLEKAAKETTGADLDNKLAYYLIYFIGIALVVAFLIVLIVKQGKDRRETVWTPSFGQQDEKEDPYEELRSEDAPDPFAEEAPEREGPPSSSEKSDDEEDIFRF